MAIRGKALTPEIKKSVVSAKKYFDLCRSLEQGLIPVITLWLETGVSKRAGLAQTIDQ